MRKNAEPFITVIIPVRGLKDGILPCLRALTGSTVRSETEILVVDMGSEDGTEAAVREFAGALAEEKDAPVLRFFKTGGRTGRCNACNTGFMLTRTPYAAVVSPSVRVGKHCLERLTEALKERPDALGARTQEPGVIVYRMEALEETGIYDERFYEGLEDLDLAYRGVLRGFCMLRVPNAYSKAGEVHKDPVTESILLSNLLYMLYKNMPSAQRTLNSPLLRLVMRRYRRYFAETGREDLFEAAVSRAEDLCLDAECSLAREQEELDRIGLPLPGACCLDLRDERTLRIYPLQLGSRMETSFRDFPAHLRIQGRLLRQAFRAAPEGFVAPIKKRIISKCTKM